MYTSAFVGLAVSGASDWVLIFFVILFYSIGKKNIVLVDP